MEPTTLKVKLPSPTLAIRFSQEAENLEIVDEFVDSCLPVLGKLLELRINNVEKSSELSYEQVKRSFRTTPVGVLGRFYFSLKTDAGYHCGFSSPPNDGPLLRISSISERELTERPFLQDLHQLAQQYAQKEETHGLSISIQFSTASNGWVPDVPGSPSTDLVRLIRIPGSVKRAYPNPEVYWTAWDNQEILGERVLVSRALNIDDVLEYRQSVYPRIWELARRAYPGQCTYYSPTFRNAEERALFNEGPQTIRLVGYNAELQIAEATCYVDDGQHIAPREILGLREALLDGQLPDGRAVKIIRVVFPSKEMAMQEGVPLLDVGVTVVYLDRQMQDRLLTAEDYTALA